MVNPEQPCPLSTAPSSTYVHALAPSLPTPPPKQHPNITPAQKKAFIQRCLLKAFACHLQEVPDGKDCVLGRSRVLAVGQLVDGLDAVGDAAWGGE
jgi:hypothetical protein